MQTPCPECGATMTELEPEAEMLSVPGRFFCSECQLLFERDATGLLREVEDGVG